MANKYNLKGSTDKSKLRLPVKHKVFIGVSLGLFLLFCVMMANKYFNGANIIKGYNNQTNQERLFDYNRHPIDNKKRVTVDLAKVSDTLTKEKPLVDTGRFDKAMDIYRTLALDEDELMSAEQLDEIEHYESYTESLSYKYDTLIIDNKVTSLTDEFFISLPYPTKYYRGPTTLPVYIFRVTSSTLDKYLLLYDPLTDSMEMVRDDTKPLPEFSTDMNKALNAVSKGVTVHGVLESIITNNSTLIGSVPCQSYKDLNRTNALHNWVIDVVNSECSKAIVFGKFKTDDKGIVALFSLKSDNAKTLTGESVIDSSSYYLAQNTDNDIFLLNKISISYDTMLRDLTELGAGECYITIGKTVNGVNNGEYRMNPNDSIINEKKYLAGLKPNEQQIIEDESNPDKVPDKIGDEVTSTEDKGIIDSLLNPTKKTTGSRREDLARLNKMVDKLNSELRANQNYYYEVDEENLRIMQVFESGSSHYQPFLTEDAINGKY